MFLPARCCAHLGAQGITVVILAHLKGREAGGLSLANKEIDCCGR